jgi:Protein of unknown function (DUF2690)
MRSFRGPVGGRVLSAGVAVAAVSGGMFAAVALGGPSPAGAAAPSPGAAMPATAAPATAAPAAAAPAAAAPAAAVAGNPPLQPGSSSERTAPAVDPGSAQPTEVPTVPGVPSLSSEMRGCSADTCNGLDPNLSSGPGGICAAGARNVNDLSSGEQGLGGLLELRYGPNCGTNWTRFTPGNNDAYEIWVTRLGDGVWAGSGLNVPYQFAQQAGVAQYSDQVYANSGPAAACVRDVTTNSQDFCYRQTS